MIPLSLEADNHIHSFSSQVSTFQHRDEMDSSLLTAASLLLVPGDLIHQNLLSEEYVERRIYFGPAQSSN